jgi:hypothetical protein
LLSLEIKKLKLEKKFAKEKDPLNCYTGFKYHKDEAIS